MPNALSFWTPTDEASLGFAASAATTGCAAAADESAEAAGSASSEYRSFRPLDADAYSCSVSDGARATTAKITRTLSQRIAQPSEHVFVQTVQFAEPVFSAATTKLGPYGCAHNANEGWSVSTRSESYAGVRLPAQISFDISKEAQWRNCDYDASETVSVTQSGSDIRVSFSLERNWGGRVAFSGTCKKDVRSGHSP